MRETGSIYRCGVCHRLVWISQAGSHEALHSRAELERAVLVARRLSPQPVSTPPAISAITRQAPPRHVTAPVFAFPTAYK